MPSSSEGKYTQPEVARSLVKLSFESVDVCRALALKDASTSKSCNSVPSVLTSDHPRSGLVVLSSILRTARLAQPQASLSWNYGSDIRWINVAQLAETSDQTTTTSTVGDNGDGLLENFW
jgi:hypothetical protein